MRTVSVEHVGPAPRTCRLPEPVRDHRNRRAARHALTSSGRKNRPSAGYDAECREVVVRDQQPEEPLDRAGITNVEAAPSARRNRRIRTSCSRSRRSRELRPRGTGVEAGLGLRLDEPAPAAPSATPGDRIEDPGLDPREDHRVDRRCRSPSDSTTTVDSDRHPHDGTARVPEVVSIDFSVLVCRVAACRPLHVAHRPRQVAGQACRRPSAWP